MVTKDEKEVRLLEVPTGKERARWQENWLRAFFDHSGQWLVLESKTGLIRLIDTASGQENSRINCETPVPPAALWVDADLLAVSCKEGVVRSFKTSTGKETAHFKLNAPVQFFSPDARFIVSQDKEKGILQLNEITTGREFGRIATSGSKNALPRGMGIFGQASFSCDGRYFATPSPGGSIQLVDLSLSAPYSALKLEAVRKGRLVFSADRRLLAYAGPDHVIRVIDMATGREVLALRHDEPAFPVSISSDGRVLITTQKSILRLNEIETGREVARLERDWDGWPPISPDQPWPTISPDRNYMVTEHKGENGRLIELGSLKEIVRFPFTDFSKATFSPDGRLLAITSEDNDPLKLIEIASGTERLRIATGGRLYAPAFSPDGQTLAVDGNDGFVRLIDISSGRERARCSIYGPRLLEQSEYPSLAQRAVLWPSANSWVTMATDSPYGSLMLAQEESSFEQTSAHTQGSGVTNCLRESLCMSILLHSVPTAVFSLWVRPLAIPLASLKRQRERS